MIHTFVAIFLLRVICSLCGHNGRVTGRQSEWVSDPSQCQSPDQLTGQEPETEDRGHTQWPPVWQERNTCHLQVSSEQLK